MSTNFSIQIPQVTIREANPLDTEALRRLAGRDSASLPDGPLVVGEVDGEIRVAVSVASGTTIADPFHRTADVIALVHARVDQLRSRRRQARARVAARTPAAPRSERLRLRAAA